MTGIYKITNKINGHAYIGKATDIARRWRKHKGVGPEDHEYEYPLYKAFRKYGIENFTFDVIEECLVSELDNKEIYWIAFYDTYCNGYNQTKGGNSPTHSKKIDEKILNAIDNLLATTTLTQKEIAIQYDISEEMVQGINTGRYWKRDRTYPIRVTKSPNVLQFKYYCSQCGKSLYSQNKTGLCQDCYKTQISSKRGNLTAKELALDVYHNGFTKVGQKYGVSDNAVKKWCVTLGLPKLKPELKQYVEEQILHLPPKVKGTTKPRPVVQLDIETETYISEFPTLSDAANAIGVSNGDGHISDVCKGKRKTAYGYKWKYKEDYLER